MRCGEGGSGGGGCQTGREEPVFFLEASDSKSPKQHGPVQEALCGPLHAMPWPKSQRSISSKRPEMCWIGKPGRAAA
jgi:hypothetical protein